jgi:dihydropteroate synthase
MEFDTPIVMGIINVTPDSFYSGSRQSSAAKAVEKANKMLSEGAQILDIGGYSSRPGADYISIQEEMDRVMPVIQAVRGAFPNALISIDSFRQAVAEEAVQIGVDMVNDISGGTLDETMLDWIAEQSGVPYIMMHMRGTPQNMKGLNQYDDLVPDIIRELQRPYSYLRSKGKSDIILDPGFGFAKDISQNFELLSKLDQFKLFDVPLLVGLSRKSMIYRSLGVEAEEALAGTISLNTLALLKGASILRVHDVKEAVQTIELLKLLP